MISYAFRSPAPHQNMMLAHLSAGLPGAALEARRIDGRGPAGRAALLARAAADALRRHRMIYFSSFAAMPFAAVAALLGHPRWAYHSQDWIQDRGGLRAAAERFVVRRAPLVIWNEPRRAAEIARLSGRRGRIHVVPTYLPRAHPVPGPSAIWRARIAAAAGLDPNAMVAIFAGGYAPARLSEEAVSAVLGVPDAALVFTGPARVPEAGGRIVDLGDLPHGEMLAAAASCDMGLLLYAHRASFGHAHQQPGRLTEYLRAGLRIVATPFADARRVAAGWRAPDGDPVCLLAEDGDVPGLGRALERMAYVVRAAPPEARAAIAARCGQDMAFEDVSAGALADLRAMAA